MSSIPWWFEFFSSAGRTAKAAPIWMPLDRIRTALDKITPSDWDNIGVYERAWMIITIKGSLGNTKVEQERAMVEAGEPIEWSVALGASQDPVPFVTWQVYFDRESPFREFSWLAEIVVKTHRPKRWRWRHRNKPAYEATIRAGEANEPGEYKYGVRAFSGSSSNLLSDDDAYLIVRRRR